MYYKLSDYAKKFNITYRAAWNRFKAGKIKDAFVDDTNHVCIPVHKMDSMSKNMVIYSRVSSNEMKENLERQSERLTNYAISNGYTIIKVVKEVGSGLNDHRPKLMKVLTDNNFDFILVENKDRLTRFGFNYLETLLKTQNKQIIVVNNTNDDKTDIINDLVSIIYSFSARIYGLRRAKNKQKEILNIINN
jgi:putative resolvase